MITHSTPTIGSRRILEEISRAEWGLFPTERICQSVCRFGFHQVGVPLEIFVNVGEATCPHAVIYLGDTRNSWVFDFLGGLRTGSILFD